MSAIARQNGLGAAPKSRNPVLSAISPQPPPPQLGIRLPQPLDLVGGLVDDVKERLGNQHRPQPLDKVSHWQPTCRT
jgi:hypothetical protein